LDCDADISETARGDHLAFGRIVVAHQARIFAYPGRLGLDSAMAPGNKYLSKGLTRSRTDNLVIMRSAEPATDTRRQPDRHRRSTSGAVQSFQLKNRFRRDCNLW
jgi:hypothetical protein